MCAQTIPTTVDNRKWPPKPERLYFWNYDRQRRNLNGKYGVYNHDELERCRQVISTTTDNQNGNIGVNNYIAIFGCQSLSQSLDDTFSSSLWSKTPDLPLEFGYCLSLFQIYYHFRFAGRIAISVVHQYRLYFLTLSLSLPLSFCH